MADLLEVSNAGRTDRVADLVFIHGLDGHPRATWEADRSGTLFWPAWIGADRPHVGVWSIGYPARSSAWCGHTMPLGERAANILDLMEQRGLGTRPLIFVVHSLGGLVLKQALQKAHDAARPAWRELQRQTRGIVFLATPHSGSRLANIARRLFFLRPTASVRDLLYNSPQLRDLATWFRDRHHVGDFDVLVYAETRSTVAARVVDPVSTDPALPNVYPIPMDDTHGSICKPVSRESQVYRGVVSFLDKCIGATTSADQSSSPAAPSSFSNNQFSNVKQSSIAFGHDANASS